MRAVNLLPKDAGVSPRRRSAAPVLLAATAPLVAGSLVFVGWSFEHRAVTQKESDFQTVTALTTTAKPSGAAQAQLSALIASDRLARRSALDLALANEANWSTTLSDLARVLPTDVWLTQLSAASPEPANPSTTSSGASSFSIQGYTYSQESVAHLLERLALVPTLTAVTLGSSNTTASGTKTLVQFQVTATVAPTIEPGAST
jgi:Tfp pilus assembly protein PilN